MLGTRLANFLAISFDPAEELEMQTAEFLRGILVSRFFGFAQVHQSSPYLCPYGAGPFYSVIALFCCAFSPFRCGKEQPSAKICRQSFLRYAK